MAGDGTLEAQADRSSATSDTVTFKKEALPCFRFWHLFPMSFGNAISCSICARKAQLCAPRSSSENGALVMCGMKQHKMCVMPYVTYLSRFFSSFTLCRPSQTASSLGTRSLAAPRGANRTRGNSGTRGARKAGSDLRHAPRRGRRRRRRGKLPAPPQTQPSPT